MRRLAAIALLLASRAIASGPANPPAPVIAEAGGAKVTVSTQASAVRVGQPVTVDFTIDRPAGSSIELPNLPTSIEAWDIRGAQTLPVDAAHPDRLVERVTFVTFEAGEQKVPSLSFTVRSGDGQSTKLESPTLAIAVATLNENGFDPRSIRDAKGAVEVPVAPVWPWILAICAAALAVLSLVWGLRARIITWFFRPPPPETPHERATRELDALQALALPAAGRVQDFYVQLTGVVRHLIEGHFGIRAPEQTTAEFLRSARHHPGLLEAHQRFLAGFMRSADLVKFAGDRPATTECERSLQAARQFVSETAPREGTADHAVAEPTASGAAA